ASGWAGAGSAAGACVGVDEAASDGAGAGSVGAGSVGAGSVGAGVVAVSVVVVSVVVVSVGAGWAAATTPLGAEVAVAVPPAFVAVTTTRNVEPTSPEVSGSCEPLAPSTAPQLPPEASQRCQANDSVAAGSLQLPPLAL